MEAENLTAGAETPLELFKIRLNPQESSAAKTFRTESAAMDSDMESARYQQGKRLGTRFYDMASLFSRRSNVSLVLPGFFILPASHTINPNPPIQQPQPGMGSFAPLGLDENVPFEDPSGSRVVLSNEAYRIDLDFVQEAALDANFEFDFDFPSQIEVGPDQGRMSQTPLTNLSTDDFPPANSNEIFSSDMPGQEYEFHHGLETQNAPSTVPETSISSNDYDQPNPHNPYGFYDPGQEIALSNSLEINSCEPSSSQETSFSSTFSDFSHENQNLSEILASPDQRFSSEFETNHPDIQPTHLTTPSIPSIQSLHTSPTLPSSNPISPDRHTCPHCPRTFKRLGDVKRHEKVHIPGQRHFHCRQAGCERKAGFYRRDKLRDHVKTVHGS